MQEGGADAHKWHAYVLDLDDTPSVQVKEEGGKPVWLTLDEALTKDRRELRSFATYQ